LAIFSKKGSALVREKREQAERQKAAAKMASLGGTALGNIMGVRDEEADAIAAAAGTSLARLFFHLVFVGLVSVAIHVVLRTVRIFSWLMYRNQWRRGL
jgi:hypothetical protein